jgi:hypothetical protein
MAKPKDYLSLAYRVAGYSRENRSLTPRGKWVSSNVINLHHELELRAGRVVI